MPLISIKKTCRNSLIGLWQIDGNICIEDVCPKCVSGKISQMCQKRQDETAAVYATLKEICKRLNPSASTNKKSDVYVPTIEHDSNGKPLLDNGWNISISHTIGFACVIISQSKTVALDIEYVNNRVFKIANRFLSIREKQDLEGCAKNETFEQQRTRLLLYWCAKETIYKYFSEENLSFDDIFVNIGKKIERCGEIEATNKKSGRTIRIAYTQNNEYVLTYT